MHSHLGSLGCEMPQLGWRVTRTEGTLWVKQCYSVSSLCCSLCTSEIGTAGKKTHPGPWPVPLHLQSANCHGDEKALLQCGYREAVPGACNQGSAMVTCVPPEGKSPGEVPSLILASVLLIRCKIWGCEAVESKSLQHILLSPAIQVFPFLPVENSPSFPNPRYSEWAHFCSHWKMAVAYDHLLFLSNCFFVCRQQSPGHCSSPLKSHPWPSSTPRSGLQSRVLLGGWEGRMH